MDQGRFYDEIAAYYDLIYADWEASMVRHGAAISALLGRTGDEAGRILDISAGIGTQALPLAQLGFEVVARDVSEGAVRRLRSEARARGLEIDAARSDMRAVGDSVTGRFDGIISMDNSIPHLLTDDDIVATCRGVRTLLAPDGVFLISVRDYSGVDRAPRSSHPYGVRARSGRNYRLGQEWEWYDDEHYRTTMVVEVERGDGWEEVARTDARYYAVSIARLLELMSEAGFHATRVGGSPFFQPVLRGVVHA